MSEERPTYANNSQTVVVDADNGYGDHKNVVHVVHSLERLGAHRSYSTCQVRFTLYAIPHNYYLV